MKKEQLQHFVDVVQTGSINKASEHLYITQPTLSRSIRSLEEEMGKSLLIRNSRGVSLSPTGKIFYNYAQSILNQFNVLERLKNLDEETVYSQLSVAVDSIFLKDDSILRFYHEMHSIETEIKMLETTAEDTLVQVAQGTSELGITILNNYQLQVFRKMADVKEVDLQILGESPVYIHAHESCAIAEKDTVSAKDIVPYIYIHLPFDFISSLNHSLEVENVHLSDLRRNITMSNYHAIIKMIHNTDSFLIGHKWQIEELKASGIKSMKLKNSSYTKYFVILKRKKEVLSPAGKVFMNIIINDYKDI